MTIKLGRHLNLEFERKHKENEEKLLEGLKKYRRKQSPITSPKNVLNNKKNEAYKPTIFNKKKIGLKCTERRSNSCVNQKLICSLPSPDNTWTKQNVVNNHSNGDSNIVVDSDISGISDTTGKNVENHVQRNGKIASVNINNTEESHHDSNLCSANVIEKGCGCLNYSVLFSNLKKNEFLTMPDPVVKMGVVEYEHKLREKIRVLEQQEKILDNRIIIPKVVNDSRFAKNDRLVNTRHFQKANEGDRRNNNEQSSSSSSRVPANDNKMSEEKTFERLLLNELFISKISENILNNLRKNIVLPGSSYVQKSSQTSQVHFDRKDTKSEMCQTNSTVISKDVSCIVPSPTNGVGNVTDKKQSRYADKAVSVKLLTETGSNNKDVLIYEDKAINTDENVIAAGKRVKHTRHKSSCGKSRSLKYKNSRPDSNNDGSSGYLESNEDSAIGSSYRKSSRSDDVRVSTSDKYYKAVQVVVNVRAEDGKVVTTGKSLTDRSKNERKSAMKTNDNDRNWRKLLNDGVDKLTESSYYSPPNVEILRRHVDNNNEPIVFRAGRTMEKNVIDNQKTIRTYIERLLTMKQRSIDRLDVSSCSTPSEISLIFDNKQDDDLITTTTNKVVVANKNNKMNVVEGRNHSKSILSSDEIEHADIKFSYDGDSDNNSRCKNNNEPVGVFGEIETPKVDNDNYENGTIGRHLSTLNLSMTDFEQNLKALYEEFDRKLYQLQDDEKQTATTTERTAGDNTDGSRQLRRVIENTKSNNRLLLSLSSSPDDGKDKPDDRTDNLILPYGDEPNYQNANDNEPDQSDDLPNMMDLLKIGLIDHPFKYALADASTDDDDLEKILEINYHPPSSKRQPLTTAIENLSSDNTHSVSDNEVHKTTEPLLSPATTAVAELDHVVRQLGFSWMSATLKKTKEASALVSSSSGHENGNEKYFRSSIDNKNNNDNEEVVKNIVRNQNRHNGKNFTPVTKFFKQNEKHVSPIGNQPIEDSDIYSVSSSQKDT